MFDTLKVYPIDHCMTDMVTRARARRARPLILIKGDAG